MFLVGKRNYRDLPAAQMAAERSGLTITRLRPEPTPTPIRKAREPRVKITEDGVVVPPKPRPRLEPDPTPATTVKAGARVWKNEGGDSPELRELQARFAREDLAWLIKRAEELRIKEATRKRDPEPESGCVREFVPLREPTVSTPPKFRFIRPRPRRERGC